MWQFHRCTGSADWRRHAEHYSKLLEPRQFDRKVHDLGFIFLNTYLPWYELTHYLLNDVLIQAGRTLRCGSWKMANIFARLSRPIHHSSTS